MYYRICIESLIPWQFYYATVSLPIQKCRNKLDTADKIRIAARIVYESADLRVNGFLLFLRYCLPNPHVPTVNRIAPPTNENQMKSRGSITLSPEP